MTTCDSNQHWTFDQLLVKISSLPLAQLQQLEASVSSQVHKLVSAQSIEDVWDHSFCVHCGSSDVVKNGHARGLQRYACRTCSHTYSNASQTPLSGLHRKDRLAKFAQCMGRDMTIRQTALEMGISTSTAFRWRHRFLSEAVEHQARNRSGVIEADETYFRQSSKGSRNLGRPPRSRGGAAMKSSKGGAQVAEKIAVLVMKTRGKPYVADRVVGTMTQANAMPMVKQMAAQNAFLCVDGSGAFRTVQQTLGIKTEAVAVAYEGRVRMTPDGPVHVQSVNNYHEKLKTWLNGDLRGVSTKYMPNYLAWMRMKEWFDGAPSPENFIFSALGKQVINTN